MSLERTLTPKFPSNVTQHPTSMMSLKEPRAPAMPTRV
jgi:hypothetical protein